MSIAFVIERGIPIPPRPRGPGRTPGSTKYPFPKMRVGDSFEIDKGTPAMRAIRAAHKYGKTYGCQYSLRSNGKSARIWRIA